MLLIMGRIMTHEERKVSGVLILWTAMPIN